MSELTPLRKLSLVAEHFNETMPHASLQVSGDGDTITISNGSLSERFTVSGQQITGRGGSFDLRNDVTVAERAVMTVLPHARITSSSYLTSLLARLGVMGLAYHLNELGFTLTAARSLHRTYNYTLFPVRAEHQDGRVLWLSVYDRDRDLADDGICFSLHAASHWLATYFDGMDHECKVLMTLSDEELAEEGVSAPDEHVPCGWMLREEALIRLLLDPNAESVPGTVPGDFYASGRCASFPLEHLRVSRETTRLLRQQERARGEEGPPEDAF